MDRRELPDLSASQVPVVGPTVALRGWAGGPGFAVSSAVVPAPRHSATGWSGWQHSQGLWQDSGISWEPPAVEPAVDSAWSDYAPSRGAGQSWRPDGSGQVALPPAFAAAPTALAAPTRPQPIFTPMSPGFTAMPLGAPTLADAPILADTSGPPRGARPPLNEPDELYRAWQGSVRRASGRPKASARRRRQAWQVLRVGVPVAVIVSVGAGAVMMLTGKPGSVIADRADQASAGVGGQDGAFSGYPGQRGAVTISSITSASGIQLAVGSADTRPAIWRHDANGTWTLVSAASPALYQGQGTEDLTGVAHGLAGWIAIGDDVSGGVRRPVVVTSANGVTWQPLDITADFAGPGISITGVAASRDGYVVVGRQVSAGRVFAVMWWSADLRTWAAGSNGGLDGRLQPSAAYAVAAVPDGFIAAGTHGSGSAIWTSLDGRTWSVHDIAAPPGASAAVLSTLTSSGTRIVAAGYAATRAGDVPIVAASADGGAHWQQAVLSAPGGLGAVNALTAAGSGFVVAGRVGPAGAQRAVTWSSPDGLSWSAPIPAASGVGEITALAASGATVTGIAQQGADPSVITLPAP